MATPGHLLAKRQIKMPSLSFSDLLASGQEPNYLSPPSSSTPPMSPPPRQQADDYLSSNAPRPRKSKRRRNADRKSNSPLIQSEDKWSTEASSAHSTPLSQKLQNFDLRDTKSAGTDVSHPVDPPPSLASPNPDVSIRERRALSRIASLNKIPLGRFVPEPLHEVDDTDDSPALNALRRISRCMTQTSDSRRRDVKHLSRTLTDKLNTVFTFKENKSGLNRDENKETSRLSAFWERTWPQEALRSSTDTYKSMTSMKSNYLTTEPTKPAVITLRKASEALLVDAPADSNSMSKISAIPLESSALPNFVVPKCVREIDDGTQENENLPEASTALSGSHVINQRSPPWSSCDNTDLGKHQGLSDARRTSASRLGNVASNPMYSLPADTALTVTDFYPNFGTLVTSKPRASSISPERTPYAMSIVQFVSRKSVHEVIWNDNEISSSGNSSSPTSLAENGHMSQMNSNVVGKNPFDICEFESLSHVGCTADIVSRPFPRAPGADQEDSLANPSSAHKRLFTWSWGNGQSSDKNSEKFSSMQTVHRSNTFHSGGSISVREAPKIRDPVLRSAKPRSESHPTYECLTKSLTDPHNSFIGSSRTENQREGEVQQELDRGLEMFRERMGKIKSFSCHPATRSNVNETGRTANSVRSSTQESLK